MTDTFTFNWKRFDSLSNSAPVAGLPLIPEDNLGTLEIAHCRYALFMSALSGLPLEECIVYVYAEWVETVALGLFKGRDERKLIRDGYVSAIKQLSVIAKVAEHG